MKAKIVPTIMLIMMVFTYLMVCGQAATAQQPDKVEQNNICQIIDSLSHEVDSYCNAVYDNDSLYTESFLRQWEDSLIDGIQIVLWEYKLTPSDLFEVFEPMYECNCTHLWDFDLDCAIDAWTTDSFYSLDSYWEEYNYLVSSYYAKWQVILSNK